jgi:anaerobic ribonucleoside-triphosphate reductase activating protein
MYYGALKNCDIANGIGVRVTLFVSGCTNCCEGCFNPDTWDFKYGDPFTEETEEEILKMLEPDYIRGFTVLGGEPFEPENQRVLVELLRRVRAELPGKDIWSYSGYSFDVDMKPGGKAYCEVTDEMLSMLDILVDGEFVLEKKDISLRFRGSSNQRIIDVKTSLAKNDLILSGYMINEKYS